MSDAATACSSGRTMAHVRFCFRNDGGSMVAGCLGDDCPGVVSLYRRVERRGPTLAWVKLISLDRCAAGRGTFVEYDGVELAVFRFDDPERVIVIDNACPHASGNLSGGEVKGEVVTCPWHYWEFNLTTGVCTHSEHARVRTYPAEVREGWVWVKFG